MKDCAPRQQIRPSRLMMFRSVKQSVEALMNNSMNNDTTIVIWCYSTVQGAGTEAMKT